MIEIWKATGMDMNNVQFLWASEEVRCCSVLFRGRRKGGFFRRGDSNVATVLVFVDLEGIRLYWNTDVFLGTFLKLLWLR